MSFHPFSSSCFSSSAFYPWSLLCLMERKRDDCVASDISVLFAGPFYLCCSLLPAMTSSREEKKMRIFFYQIFRHLILLAQKYIRYRSRHNQRHLGGEVLGLLLFIAVVAVQIHTDIECNSQWRTYLQRLGCLKLRFSLLDLVRRASSSDVSGEQHILLFYPLVVVHTQLAGLNRK